ncbi:large-conductance mechanosensitive channel protein MscL [Aquipluma nitroreducens]|nr:large-conductance mechanosensitive channel protein MscL [Aquipluma nitroreducens]
MSLVKEFKEFAMRGNVVDLAVGIIIGGAFGKIVSSVVADVLMPPIGLLLGGVKFTDLKIFLTDPVVDAAGVITKQAVSINYGNFVQALVDFLIIAFAIFMMIKGMNSMKKKEVAAAVEAPAPPPPSNEEVLLAEIRDILKNK